METATLANIKKAKENRFTLSSQILAESGIRVEVFNDPSQCPADYNIETKLLRLNEAHPNASNPVYALVFDRAKLFHELAHALFTKDENKKRYALCEKSSNKGAFLDMSNILEDGRIERLICEAWSGAKYYLDAILGEEIKTLAPTPEMGLALYVRTGMFRNKGEEKVFAPYIKQIDHAVNGAKDCGEVCDIAFDICEKLYPPTPKGEEQGEGEQGEKGKGEGESQLGEGETSDKRKEPEDESKPNSDDSGEFDGEQGEASDSEQGEASDSEQGEGEGHGKNKVNQISDSLDDSVAEKVQKIVEKAKDQVLNEAKEDYESILQDARDMDDSLQGFANSGEENGADELATLFTSLLVEVNRTKFRASREGILNTLALSSALTTRKCFQIRQEALGAPYVALLLDTSGSQRYREEAFTQASRIIYGSLQKAKVNVLLIQYSDYARVISHIPVEKPFEAEGMTHTGEAMTLANNWFEEQGASRALMLVLTDGSPDRETMTLQEKQRAEELNAYVLGVRVGFTPCALVDHQVASLQNQFHSHVDVPDANDLPQAIEPHLETFLAGV